MEDTSQFNDLELQWMKYAQKARTKGFCSFLKTDCGISFPFTWFLIFSDVCTSKRALNGCQNSGGLKGTIYH